MVPLPNRVLIIEDDPVMREVLCRALMLAKYEARAVGDANEAISHAREFRPTVVVCDVHLPGRLGTEVLTQFREDESLEMTQFILITGDREGTSLRTGMNLGADDYLHKPFAIDEFIRSVRTRFRRAEFARKADARAIAKLKDTITKQLPHELLTPLSGILGLSEVLQEDFQNNSATDNQEMLRDIHRSAERLHHTLKNYFRILEVLDEGDETEREEGTVLVQESATILSETARRVAQKFGRLQDLQVFSANVALPLSRTNFTSIIGELVDNAFKYSHPGTRVDVELRRHDDFLHLRVSDHGRGMTPEQIGHIGAFRQFDRTKYEQQGLGLGLTLTQHVIERTGGAFTLESAPGSGTLVRVSWPLLATTP